ncbi:hypothetical protein NDU88_008389 [Pleurodeles waltl]|uniref:Uncharacterized protein n=1 Tax=Pleurodeles waltl TaxID=8319 RepID=A0AAV7RXJ0_PLEWA|nr:hypothetical protein NDU88_008389 [Pleurodeles waltl]
MRLGQKTAQTPRGGVPQRAIQGSSPPRAISSLFPEGRSRHQQASTTGQSPSAPGARTRGGPELARRSRTRRAA